MSNPRNHTFWWIWILEFLVFWSSIKWSVINQVLSDILVLYLEMCPLVWESPLGGWKDQLSIKYSLRNWGFTILWGFLKMINCLISYQQSTLWEIDFTWIFCHFQGYDSWNDKKCSSPLWETSSAAWPFFPEIISQLSAKFDLWEFVPHLSFASLILVV